MRSKRERLLLLVTVLAAGLYILDSYVLAPLNEKADELATEREKLETTVLANDTLLRQRETLAKKWSRWGEGSLTSDPSEAERRALNAVRSWAQEAGVTIGSIQPERAAAKGVLREVRFQASARGRYESLVRFMLHMETAEIPLRVLRLELRTEKDDANQIGLDVTFSTLFRMGETAAEGGREAAAPRGGV